jgi:arylsulfate sulfotransferase
VKRCLFLPAFLLLSLCGCGTSTTNVNLSGGSQQFGVTLVGTSVTQTVAVVKNTGNAAITLKPTITGATDFSLASAGACGTTLAAGQTCNVVVTYAPPTGSSPMLEGATVDLGVAHLPGTDAESVTVTGTPGVPSISLSESSYGFGDQLVGGSATQTAAVVTNTGNVALTLAPAVSGDPSFSLGSGGCGTALAVGAMCNVVVQYAPTVASNPAQQTATVNLGLAPLVSGMVTVTGTSGAITGTVTPTANTMVALYTLTLPFPGTWTVAFGPTTGYGLTTSMVTAATAGTATSVFVAGMLPNSTYHMKATATLADGSLGSDVDHTFATGALPTGIPASFPVKLGTGTPQPGIELMDPLMGTIPTSLIATDLKGNVIWAYKPVLTTGAPFVYPAKLLTNGDVLMYVAPNSYPTGAPGIDVLREIDLAGDTVKELNLATLNTEMVTAGFPITLDYFTHDFISLPNGHTLVMANTTEVPTNLTGYPAGTKVVGDVVIDLDANWNPDWVWNEFDHFDVNRHPWAAMFPDWTHSNSLSYSTDDGDFIVSMRHQNLVAKVDFNNASGTGSVVWTLGEGGSFKLVGGVDPTDWFYAQHDVTYATTNTTGVYSVTVMDNGDDRIYPNGGQCGTTGEPACYSTIQELQLDDSAMTATFQFHQILPESLYSSYGGDVEALANGDIEYDLAGIFTTGSQTFEVTPGSNPQTVWQMTTPGSEGYRTFRMPSLYPGVQW